LTKSYNPDPNPNPNPNLVGIDKESPSKGQEKALKRALFYFEEGTEVAFDAVRELLVRLEKPSCGGANGWSPKYTGTTLTPLPLCLFSLYPKP
jgi:hypothetical protein